MYGRQRPVVPHLVPEPPLLLVGIVELDVGVGQLLLRVVVVVVTVVVADLRLWLWLWVRFCGGASCGVVVLWLRLWSRSFVVFVAGLGVL